MATKGERTRRRIVERAAPVFNTRGYFGASMSDLVRETGLEKGGIYNHFSGKEELALEAFDYATGLMRERLRAALAEHEGVLEKLLAVVDVFGTLAYDPPVEGGCPVLNTAVEADDAQPVLKERARGAAVEWLRLVGSLVKEGIGSGELESATDPRATASVVVGAIEGAVMLTKLTDDPAHMDRAVEHVKGHLRSLARPRDPGEE
jgi:TetR/AcrR family transcriptional regulator, transcriptional repressor for nem operon